MTFTVTIEGLVVLLLEILGLVVGCYLMVVLKNANRLIKDVNKTLTKNQEKIDGLLHHVEELTGTSAHLSGELRKHFDGNKALVNSIFQTGANSMLLMNDATSRIESIISNINQIVRNVNRFIKKIL